MQKPLAVISDDAELSSLPSPSSSEQRDPQNQQQQQFPSAVATQNSEDEAQKDTFYNVLTLAVFQFLSPEDVLNVRKVSKEWRKRLNNTPLLLCSMWQALPYDVYWSIRKNELRYPVQMKSVVSLCPELNPGMLHTLFKWMIDLAVDYGISLQSVFCSCRIVSRTLGSIPVARKHLQLLGMIAFLLGAKIHERQPPLIQECVEACANLYSAEEIKLTEVKVAKTLKWSLNSPTVFTVVMHVLSSQRFDVHVDCHCLAVFLCEMTLTDWELAAVFPTLVGVALVSLSQYTYGLPYWRTVMMSGYNPAHLLDAAERVHACWVRHSTGQETVLSKAIQERYSGKEVRSVSSIRPPPRFLEDFRSKM